MILTEEILKDIAERVNEPHRVHERLEDWKRYQLFNGKTKRIIESAMAKEFANPETFAELLARLIPLNLTRKIITKLAGIYTQAPVRKVTNDSPTDQELLDQYVDEMDYNQRQKEANRYFKLYKRNLQEFFVDEDGYPACRNIPRHQYEVFSLSTITPNRPDVIVKILEDGGIGDPQVMNVWTKESQVIVNEKGQPIEDRMKNNPEGVNSYNVLPFVYMNESSDSVDPLSNDDLLSMSVAIPVLLTDICFAIKYQCWSILYTVGLVGKILMSPHSVTAMQYDENGNEPKIGQVKPEVDTDKVLTVIKTLVALLLSTNSLSVATVTVDLDANDPASGIAKMIDSSESIEDKTDQQEFFLKAEQYAFYILSKFLIPNWRANGLLDGEINKEFSKTFDVNIFFQEPKVLISEKERVEIAKMRRDAGFSTLKKELQLLNPQLDEAAIDQLIEELHAEKQANIPAALAEGNQETDGNVESDLQDKSA